jgi:hypothetical protein
LKGFIIKHKGFKGPFYAFPTSLKTKIADNHSFYTLINIHSLTN